MEGGINAKPYASIRHNRREPRPSGRRWMQTKDAALAREPMCRTCKAKGKLTRATEVDHIEPIHKGGDWWHFDNLQPLCAECHRVKTNADMGYKHKPRIGADGWPID